MRKFLLFGLIFLATFYGYGCPYNAIPPKSDVLIFGWARDASKIITLKQSSQSGIDVIVLNLQGKEIMKSHLQKLVYINDYYFSPKLFLTDDGKGFYAQINDDVYRIGIDDGSEVILLTGEHLISVSSSGKIMLTVRSNKDTAFYSLTEVEGNLTRTISTWQRSSKDSSTATLDKLDVSFIGDSLWVGCYADTGACGFTVFDTLFSIRKKSVEQSDPPILPSFANNNKIIYLSSPNTISEFDAKDRTSKVVATSVPNFITFLDFSVDGNIFLFSISEHPSYTFITGNLMLFDLNSNVSAKIMSDVTSAGKISPDGKSIAFFTSGDNGSILHIIPVPL